MRAVAVYPPAEFFEHRQKTNVRLPFVDAPELRQFYKPQNRSGSWASALGPGPGGIERRTATRYPFVACVEAVESHSQTKLLARTNDLSRGGCYIDTFSPFPLNADTKLKISRDRLAVVARAKVVYSSVGQGMGLQFTTVQPESRNALDTWLKECDGEPRKALTEEETTASLDSPKTESQDDVRYVMSELILSLMRKGGLSAADGKAMLLKLMPHD